MFPADEPPIETGLVTVPVRVPAPVALPAPVQMPDGWTLPKVATLVTDIAQNVYELPFLLKKHNLTDAQYKVLENNDFFKRALEAEVMTWQGANSIQKRLALESAIALEAAMPTLAARLQKPTEPLGEVVSLAKVFAEMAGTVGARAQVPLGNSEKFKIIINLGGGQSTQQEVSVAPLQSVAEGQGAGSTISDLIKAP